MSPPFALKLRPGWRGAVALALLAWLPLYASRDPRVHMRLLFALPFLLYSEEWLSRFLGRVPGQFLDCGLVREEDRARFDAAVDGARVERWTAELLLIVPAVLLSWKSPESGWERWMASPLFRYALWRWVLMQALWAVFAFRVSRLRLRLHGTNPDGAGGLAFVAGSVDAFLPFAGVLGALIAGHVLWTGGGLEAAKLQAVAALLAGGLFILLPEAVFIPLLARVRRENWFRYSALAGRYIDAFEKRWLEVRPRDPLAMSEDMEGVDSTVQAYAAIRGMRLIPASRLTLAKLALAGVLPLLPLVVADIGPEKLGRVGKLLMELMGAKIPTL